MARVILKGEHEETAAAFQDVAKNFTKDELIAAQQIIRQGRVDGQRYRMTFNACGCFFGVMAVVVLGGEGKARKDLDNHRNTVRVLMDDAPDNAHLVEAFFWEIGPGAKPKNSKYALKADRWFTKAINAKAA